MTGRLENKVAIVSGAGSVGTGWGNGRAIAVRFAQEGAKVFAVDRDPEALVETVKLIEDAGGTVVTHTCDLMDSEQVNAMVLRAHEAFGRVDILANNVGGSFPGGAAEVSLQDWQRNLDHNLNGAFFGMRAVIPIMQKQGGGSIVSVASISAHRWTASPRAAYAAAKAALIQLSKVTAVQYAKDGIRVNTVSPGPLATPFVGVRLAGQVADGDLDALLQQRLKRIPLGFAGDGRDTANAALFLVSDEARWVSGADLVVDGAMTVRCD
jgi:NAD(P)-dependent dehydrogenase (short-subunit alcohol dehydrogenase family)